MVEIDKAWSNLGLSWTQLPSEVKQKGMDRFRKRINESGSVRLKKLVEASDQSSFEVAMEIRLNNTRRGWVERNTQWAQDGGVSVENEAAGGIQEGSSGAPDHAGDRSKVMDIRSLVE